MGCTVNLNDHIPANANFVGTPTWQRGPCPACTGEPQPTNPETPPIPNDGFFSTELLRPGCYTFSMRTPNFNPDCSGCGDCTNIRIEIFPEVNGVRNYTNLNIGCINGATCNQNGNSLPNQLAIWGLLNCNNIDPAVSCNAPFSNPAFTWDHGGAGPDVPITFGYQNGQSWLPASWNFVGTTLTSEMLYNVPYNATGCDGQPMAVNYRFTMTYNGNLPLQNYFSPIGGGRFNLCKYVHDGGNSPLVINITVGPTVTGECGPTACQGTSTITIGWSEATEIPPMETGRIFCNNNANP